MRPARVVPILLLLAVACGPKQSETPVTDTADKALSTALAAANAARDSFVEWDKAHQLEIVDGAKSREAGAAALAAYRVKRGKVLRAFVGAYASISAAAALVPLVARGERRDADLVGLIAEAVAAVQAVKAAIDEIKGGE